MKTYAIRTENFRAEENIALALKSVAGDNLPVFVCIGTDAVSGDSLGPLIGTLLERKLRGKTYIFGTLERPLTARDVNAAAELIKKICPFGNIIAIDAAVGRKEEVGEVRISDSPVKPGLGVNKSLRAVGDVSIVGIVDERKESGGSLGLVRFSLVYKIAEIVAGGIERFFCIKSPERRFSDCDRNKRFFV